METKSTVKNGTQRKDAYTIVNQTIIEQLEKGVIPWRVSWAQSGPPTSLITGKPFRGINLILLAGLGYEHNLFVTSKKLNEIGGALLPDAKPHIVTHWNQGEKAFTDYTVFNIAQCVNVSREFVPRVIVDSIAACEQIVSDMAECPEIKHKGKGTLYNPLIDVVEIPKQSAFNTPKEYYASLFHQLLHSTGYHTRLNRKELIQMPEFGYDAYSLEELVAEIGTGMLLSHVGIIEDCGMPKEYFENWIQRLKRDKYLMYTAASQAQKAVDYILNVPPFNEDKVQETE